jgi:Icc-related predicted phosphoesterase
MSQNANVRIAAVGDIHVREGQGQQYREFFQDISRRADVLVLCGDLTGRGLPTEGEVLAEELRQCRIPVLGVLGNHDYECGHVDELKTIVCQAGLMLLEDEPREVLGVGFAGVKGFCGGFGTSMLAPFGEAMIKEFVQETVQEALRLESSLLRLRAPHKVAVLHYAPIRDTVVGEDPEIFPFLGSSRLEEPIDRFSADVAFHGHAHRGAPEGRTVKGVPVYNVAHAIMAGIDPEHPYRIVEFGEPEEEATS